MKRLALLLLVAIPLHAKTLHWRSFDVTARLDADGRLHVLERQAIVFDGDWNGGERRFNIRPGQQLDFHGITRVNGGTEVPLVRGDLSKVDHFDFTDAATVRWRSRLPDDPPFQHSEIVYVLDYVLDNILMTSFGRRYELRHDFAFAERPGLIEAFTLRLEFDPAWEHSPLVRDAGRIRIGEGYVVNEHLRFEGSGSPHAQWEVPPVARPLSLAIVALLAAGMLAPAFRRARDVAHVVPESETIDDAWLRKYVFDFKPEVLAAATKDGSASSDAVAAALARMSHEGKMAMHVENKELQMQLLVPLESLQGYERSLANGFFFGSNVTGTAALREHYASRGFSPASKISKALYAEVRAHRLWPDASGVSSKIGLGIMLLAGAAAAGITASVTDQHILGFSALIIVATILLGVLVARAVRERGGVLAVLLPLIVLAPLVYVARNVLTESKTLFLAGDLLDILAAVAIVRSVMLAPIPLERLAWRKRWARARDFFARQLRLPKPDLRDDWYPWLLALGLGRNVDRWFSIAPPGSSSDMRMLSTDGGSGSQASSSPASPSWTGGGGAFGGAGASGGWAGAVASVAVGVSAPSTDSGGGSSGSSSSSSSGGSSSSSGGGGGGGW